MDVFRAQDAASKAVVRKMTADGFDNFLSRIGLDNDNTLSASTYEFNLVTRNRILLEAAYRGSWIVGQVIDSVADDMTRAGVDVQTSRGGKDLPKIQHAFSRLQVWQSTATTIKWGRLYGGALGVLQIEGQKLDTPLVPETVGKGQFKGIVVYDRWQLNPVMTPVIQSGPMMGLPEFYQIVNNATSSDPKAPTATGQQTVHHSRCIRYTGIDLPYFQAITEMMWGESVLERLWDRLIAFDNATMSSASLIDRANLRTVGIDGLREIIAAGGEAQAGLESMFEMMRSMQVNEGLTLLDKEDTFESTAYTFTGLSDMMLQFGQQLSGASGIPLVRLFGQSPQGLGATGEADIRMYYDNINAQQEAKLRQPFETLLKVLWRSTLGVETPNDLEFSFTPLWQMSANDQATVAKTNCETIIGARDAGLVSTPTAMKELRSSSGDTGIFANITDEEIAEAELEPAPLPDAPAPGEEKEEKTEPAKALDSAWTKFKRWLWSDNVFKEEDHPRKDDGEFGNGSGAGKSKPPEKKKKAEKKAKAPSKTEARSIRSYTGALSSQFIQLDRGDTKHILPEVQEQNRELNAYLESAPKFQGTIFRGIVVEKTEVEKLLKKFEPGKVVENDAKQSWTKSDKAVENRLVSVSNEKKNPVRVFFEYPESKIGVDVSAASNFPEEEEVVLPKDTSYTVANVTKVDGGYRITMRAA